jgi:long-chain acyl-CoA synthetase
MLEGFGMTEAAPMITFTQPGRVRAGSAGEAMSCTKIEIRDGEIVASGKNIMQGYYNRPEETAEVVKDGWLYTGDTGYLDKEGYLFITGRKKEIIVLSNGKNINPSEVEFKIERLTDCIQELGVYLHNDVIQAVIFPDMRKIRKNEVLDIKNYFQNSVMKPYNNSVSPYKKIMKFTIVHEELPKTRLSKIRRFMLPELAERYMGSRQYGKQPEYQEFTMIREFIGKNAQRMVYSEDHLEMDLAMDSLDRISLLTFLHSTFGVDIPEDSLLDYKTVGELAEHIHRTHTKIKIEDINWKAILKEKVNIRLPKTWITNSIAKNISRFIFRLFFSINSNGTKDLPDTPVIFAPNHQSMFDAFLVASFLKNKMMKKSYFYAKEKYFKMPFLRFLANRNNIIITDINKNLKKSLQKMAAVLKKGKNLIIFPEGTRTLDGTVGKFKKTFAILSRELNIPIVPVAIEGAYEVLPQGSRFPKPFRRIIIDFLKPIYPKDHSYESLANMVYQKVRDKIKFLNEEPRSRAPRYLRSVRLR